MLNYKVIASFFSFLYHAAQRELSKSPSDILPPSQRVSKLNFKYDHKKIFFFNSLTYCLIVKI